MLLEVPVKYIPHLESLILVVEEDDDEESVSAPKVSFAKYLKSNSK